MTEGILLAKTPKVEDPEDDPVEILVQQLERDWSFIGPLQGSWFNGPDCLEPIEDDDD